MIKIEKLCYEYTAWEHDVPKQICALRDISLEIERGSFTVILGANGSGKSTLAKQLNGLLQPTSGSVYIDGKNAGDIDQLWDIRRQIGLVFQNPDDQIIGTTLEEDIAFGPENRNYSTEKIKLLVNSGLEEVELMNQRTMSPLSLSGGQKQRLAMGGIIASQAEVLVLDEPTAMLDPQSRKETIATIHKFRDKGATVIMVTHHLDEAVDADKIILMKHGEIAFTGSPEQLFKNKNLVESCNLILPQAAELAIRLADAGVPIKLPVMNEQQLVSELVKLIGENNDSFK